MEILSWRFCGEVDFLIPFNWYIVWDKSVGVNWWDRIEWDRPFPSSARGFAWLFVKQLRFSVKQLRLFVKQLRLIVKQLRLFVKQLRLCVKQLRFFVKQLRLVVKQLRTSSAPRASTQTFQPHSYVCDRTTSNQKWTIYPVWALNWFPLNGKCWAFTVQGKSTFSRTWI